MKRIFFFKLIILLIVSCNQVKNDKVHSSITDLQQVREAIARSNIVYWQAFVQGDSSLFIDRYAKDACIMLPNAPSMCGEMAAQDFFSTAYKLMGIRNGKFTTTEIFDTGQYVT